MSADEDDRLLEDLGEALADPLPPIDEARMERIAAAARDAATLAPAPAPEPEPESAAPAAAGPSRRRVLWMSAAAAGGIAAGVAGAVLVTDDGPTAPNTEAAGALTTASGVDAEARLIAHGWGLEVLLDVSGLEPGARYAMTFFDRSDQAVDAGGFVGTDGLMRCRNNGAVLRADVARFEVTDTAGRVVVSADLA